MAFNPAFEPRRRASIRHTETEDNESLLSESQSSWVVFNPADRLDHDVLLFSTTNPLTTDNSEQAADAETSEEEEEEEDDDELLDEMHSRLSSKIDKWQNSTDAAVSDNIALWDLDSDLVAQLLDTSILRKVPAFYGDHVFDGMSKADYARFKRASSLLSRLLTRKGAKSVDKQLLSRLLHLLSWQNLLNTSGSLVNDYIANTLARTSLSDSPLPPFRDVELSDTATSSSLVICGGSWNDI